MNQPKSSRHILIVEEPSFRKTVVLEEATYSLGRHSSNDIIIAAQKVSRHHATLLRRTDVKTNDYSYWILDGDLQGNRSRNGIYVNGKKCLVHELKDGDVVRLSANIQAFYKTTTDEVESSAIAKQPLDGFNSLEQGSMSLGTGKSSNVLLDKKAVTTDKTVVGSRGNLPLDPESSDPELLRLADLSPQGIVELDLEGAIIYSNPVAQEVSPSISPQHPLLSDLLTVCNQENPSIEREVKVGGQCYRQNAYYFQDNNLVRSYITDISNEKRLQTYLDTQTKQYNLLFENNAFGIFVVNGVTKRVIQVNNMAAQYLGLSKLELLDQTIDNYVFEKQKILDLLHKIINEKRNYSGVVVFQKKDGSIVDFNVDIDLFDDQLEPQLFIKLESKNNAFVSDFSSKFVNLPRLDFLEQHIRGAIANADRTQKLLGLLAIRINNLSNIQTVINSDKQKVLLSSFTERIRACLRFGDIIAYGEANRFYILMESNTSIQEVAKISQRILDSLQQPFKIGEQQLVISSSIGIAVYPQDGEVGSSLIEGANTALERAAKESDYSYQFVSQNMNSQNSVMLELESFLANALARNEFILYYQPQINVNNGNIQGIEALLRWQHPELGLVSPSSFIAIAEETGLIIPIGRWVLKTACEQNKIWTSQGLPPLRVSVNLSAIQFQQPDLPLLVQEVLAETQLNPELLELEISAASIIDNLEYSHRILSQLQEMRVHVSIGDFSTDYNSWEQLKELPFNTLKISRDFVRQLKNDPQDLAIISAMVSLGKGFNLRVVAEGVETQEQIEILRSQNCEQMQGFWFSRPLAAEEASKLLPLDSKSDISTDVPSED